MSSLRELRPAGPAPSDLTHPPVPIVRPKRRTVPAACEACRKTKTRCDARRPSCSGCILRSKDCIYTVEPNETRLAAAKRNVQTVEQRLTEFEDLFHQLQSRPAQEANEILQRIRADWDVHLLLKFIKDGDLLIQPNMASAARNQTAHPPSVSILDFAGREHEHYLWTFLPTTTEANDAIMRDNSKLRAAMLDVPDFEELYDPRLYNVNPKVWTTVICDQVLFSDLLNVYFTVEHQLFGFVDRDAFLDGLNVGRRSSFCSPLLVNAMLSFACHYSSQIEDRHEPWSRRNLGSYFTAEARRLWHLEASIASLTTIQAAPILGLVYNLEGKDQYATPYHLRSIQMAQELGLFGEGKTFQTRHSQLESDETLQRVRAVTAWALFRYSSSVSSPGPLDTVANGEGRVEAFHMHRRPLLQKPPTIPMPNQLPPDGLGPRPSGSPPDRPTVGSRYLFAIQNAYNELHVIMTEISTTLSTFGSNNEATLAKPDSVAKLYQRLCDWYHSVPSVLHLENYLTPQQIHLHVHFHAVVVILTSIPRAVDSSNATHSESVESRLREAFDLSFQQMKVLIKRYASSFNFRQAPAMMMLYLRAAAFDTLAQIEDSSNRDVFDICIQGLRQISAVYYLAQAFFHAIRAAAEKKGVELPPDLSKTPVMQQLSDVRGNIYSSLPLGLSLAEVNGVTVDSALTDLSASFARSTIKTPD